jgi:hypothetical protein
MKTVLYLLCAIVVPTVGFSQPGLHLRTQPALVKPGSTLQLQADYQHAGTNQLKYSTLHVWIESIDHSRQWRLRYPMEQGVASATVVLPDSLEPGVYALAALVQREMVHLLGRVKNKNPPAEVNMVATKGKTLLFARPIVLQPDGYFQVPNLLFDNRATFVFSPQEKARNNWLDVELEAPVDSAFFVMARQTQFLAVGVPPPDTSLPSFKNWQPSRYAGGTLENVVVTGKQPTNLEKYAKRYVSGFFEGDGYIFDGIDDQLLSGSLTVVDFLAGRVAGLTIQQSRADMDQALTWRGFEPAYFIDEVQTDLQGLISVPTSEIAMVKVMRPPFYGVSMGSAGGAIAVYTKREGSGAGKFGNRFRFVVTGYTPPAYLLPL